MPPSLKYRIGGQMRVVPLVRAVEIASTDNERRARYMYTASGRPIYAAPGGLFFIPPVKEIK